MSDDKSSPAPPPDRGERIIEASDDRKGIIVMPSDTVPIDDIVNMAPSGPPAPQQAAPDDSAQPPAPSES